MADSFALHPTQAIVASDRHRFRVVDCGRRWGKTTMAIDTIKGCGVHKRDARIAYIAPTFQQARDIAWEQLKKEFSKAGATVNESRLEIRFQSIHKTETMILLRGWESIETLRGQLFDLVVIDEVASMRNFLSQWNEVVRPTLTDRRGEALFISTPKGFNHFYDLYNMQDTDPDYISYHFTSYDNPFIPRDELDKARKEIGDTRFGQEYLADFKKMEGLVYQDFDRKIHIINLKDPEIARRVRREHMVELIVGVDFGFTNPCAVLSMYRDSADNYYVLDEWYHTGKTDDEIADYIQALNATKVYPDPEAAMSIATLKKRGVNVRTVVKGKDSIKNGINRVHDLLRGKKLFISTECVNLIFEFETYAYPEGKAGKNEDENPIKDNDHALDALRYAIMMSTKGNMGVAHQFRPSSLSAPSTQQSLTAHQYRPHYKTNEDSVVPNY